jgi:uncharacterized protein YnzC (UPF0291/DUF896 family)
MDDKELRAIYRKARIANVRQGKGARAHFTYAQIVDENGDVLVNADLEYCQRVLAERRGEE